MYDFRDTVLEAVLYWSIVLLWSCRRRRLVCLSRECQFIIHTTRIDTDCPSLSVIVCLYTPHDLGVKILGMAGRSVSMLAHDSALTLIIICPYRLVRTGDKQQNKSKMHHRHIRYTSAARSWNDLYCHRLQRWIYVSGVKFLRKQPRTTWASDNRGKRIGRLGVFWMWSSL